MGALSRGEIICRKASHARLWRVTYGGARAGIRGKPKFFVRNIPSAGQSGRIGLMKIRIFLGAGGVCKTSVTAASALGTALIQWKHLVLTIDPAQRLRTALNLNAGMVSPEKIPLDA